MIEKLNKTGDASRYNIKNDECSLTISISDTLLEVWGNPPYKKISKMLSLLFEVWRKSWPKEKEVKLNTDNTDKDLEEFIRKLQRKLD